MPRLDIRTYLAHRVAILSAMVLLALLAWTHSRPAVELGDGARELAGEAGRRARIAEFVSRAGGTWIEPDNLYLVAERPRAVWRLGGSRVSALFTAVPNHPPEQLPVPSSHRDVFSVDVTVDPSGVPIDLAPPTNLTRTPGVDERILVTQGAVVLVAAADDKGVRSLHVLDLARPAAQPMSESDRPGWLATRLEHALNRRSTGRPEGIARLDLILAAPATALAVDEAEGVATVDMTGPSGRSARLRVDLNDLRLNDLRLNDLSLLEGGAHVEIMSTQAWTPPSLSVGLYEWVLGLDWLSRQQVDLLEELGAALARWRQPTWRLAVSGAVPTDSRNAAFPPRLDEPGQGLNWETTFSGDAWPASDSAPLAWTVIEPGGGGPRARVLVVALDLRQLELSYVPGRVRPGSVTGRPGRGRLSDTPTRGREIVALFNGGPDPARVGPVGSKADGHTLIPAVADAATLAWPASRGALLAGVWPLADHDENDLIALRQGSDPLVVNGRAVEGWSDPWHGLETARSGACARPPHTFFYLWADPARAADLSLAMERLGCEVGFHLDGAPHPLGFSLASEADLVDAMSFRPPRLDPVSRDDFFVVRRRLSLAERLPAPAGSRWSDEALVTTPDRLRPVAARLRIDAGTVRLVALDLSVLRSERVAGTRESPPPLAPPDWGETPVIALGLVLGGPGAGGPEARPEGGVAAWLMVGDSGLRVSPEPEELAIPLDDPSAQVDFAGTCSALGSLSDDLLVAAWGPVDEVGRRLGELGVEPWGLLGCGRHQARLESVIVEDDVATRTDLASGERYHPDALDPSTDRILFLPIDPPPPIEIVGRRTP